MRHPINSSTLAANVKKSRNKNDTLSTSKEPDAVDGSTWQNLLGPSLSGLPWPAGERALRLCPEVSARMPGTGGWPAWAGGAPLLRGDPSPGAATANTSLWIRGRWRQEAAG